jgi:predicted N-acetyltransferase YhbS
MPQLVFRGYICGIFLSLIEYKNMEDNKMIKINIRTETPADYYAVEALTREAFWGFTQPACDEHYLVHLLRKTSAFISELDFVAEIDARLVGNIMYSKAKVVDENHFEHEVITFGPLSVLPEYWNRGIGSALMKHSILKARDLVYRGIVFHGHPDYYPRFGFQNAKVFDITNSNGKNYDALMAMELYDGALSEVKGKFHDHSVFDCDENIANEYNKNFPQKEPAKMIPIDVLLEKLPVTAQETFKDKNVATLAWLNRISGREMLTWYGIDFDAMNTINKILREYNYAEKLLPGCNILEKAKTGIKLLEENIND